MHWYDWHTVTERLQGRAYALTRGRPYRVILDPNTPTGCCDFTNQKILINPNLFSDVLQRRGLTGEKLDKANFLVSRAVTGHEALHVLYSDSKTAAEAAQSPALKTVLNLLEDARIEKIGAEQSHVAKTLFRFVNGIAATQLPQFTDTSLADRSSGLSLLLRWRLGAGIPALEPAARRLWKQVHQLARKALCAATCADVLKLAREIVSILGLDKPDAPPVPDDIQKAAQRMQSDAVGERSSAALPNPIQPGDMQEPGASEDSEQSGVTGSNGTDDAGGSAIADPDPGDLERLVEETARQVSEDLDSLVPPDAGSLIARATAFRGRRYSDIAASPYASYLPHAAPIAAELVRELRAEEPRGSSGPSQCPGRFRARYYVRDSSRPYAAQRFRGLAVPRMALSLVIDRSGSMEHVIHELRVMSMAISTACEGLHIPLSIWALEGQVHIKHFDEQGPQVLAKIAGIQADTLTRVMPTISDAEAELRSRPEEVKQMVLIHDGMPSDRQDFTDWRSSLRGIGLFCLFIMRQEDYPVYQENPNQLREHMDDLVGPTNYAIAPVTGIARHWCSFVRNTRNRRAVLTA